MRAASIAAALIAAALAAPGAAAQEPRETERQDAPPTEAQDRGEAPPPESSPAQPPESSPAQQPAQTAEAPPPADSAETVASDADEEPPYTVECGPDPEEGGNVCQVDRGTYVGWRTFHSVCHTCHAQDAVGSTFAPALLPRIREMDKTRFLEVVDQGFTGQVGVMPGWAANPNVNRYYDELWSYLRARADGELAPGRPKRLPD